ncbi:MAG: hypothetical protein HC915_21965 [Anaerolineae bacterium]|nr:hypothetical protein [Anaerolineae bacterium]
MAGPPYRVSGTVVQGDGRGRRIGFPTANLETWPRQVLPANGVYACWAGLADRAAPHPAVVNIGVRPTFGGQSMTVEAHLIHFAGDLYGQTLALDFVQRLRGEQRFAGIEALVAQIANDREAAQQTLASL